MNITNLAAAVVSESGRPDKATMIERAVKAKVLQAHQLDFFPRDRIEATFVPSSPGETVTEALPARFRQFALIRPLNASGVHLDKKFTRKDPGDIFNFEGEIEPDYYYVLGTNVVMQSTDSIVKLHWVYYEYPDLSSGSTETWICTKYEQEIIDGALGYVYKKLGMASVAKAYTDLWNFEHIPRIIRDNLIEST